MKHLSKLIDDANSSVTDIKIAHGKVLMQLMQRDDFTHEQKLALVEMLKPIAESIDVAISKFLC